MKNFSKKITALITSMLLCIVLSVPAFAAGATGSMSISSPASETTGSTVTFYVNFSCSDGVGSMQGSLTADNMTISSVSMPSGFAGNATPNFAFAATGTAPASVSVAVTCKLTGAAGSTAKLTASGCQISDTNGDYVTNNPFSASGSVTIAAPATQATTKQTTASPAATTARTTTKKTTTTTTAAPAANVTTKKTDTTTTTATTIAKNAIKLSTLSINAIGTYDLTPSFDPSVSTYTLYVPSGTKSLDVKAALVDGVNGTVDVQGADALVAGKTNVVKINVTSSDGTVTTYTINVKFTKEGQVTTVTSGTEGGIPVWVLILVGILALIAGLVIGIIIAKNKKDGDGGDDGGAPVIKTGPSDASALSMSADDEEESAVPPMQFENDDDEPVVRSQFHGITFGTNGAGVGARYIHDEPAAENTAADGAVSQEAASPVMTSAQKAELDAKEAAIAAEIAANMKQTAQDNVANNEGYNAPDTYFDNVAKPETEVAYQEPAPAAPSDIPQPEQPQSAEPMFTPAAAAPVFEQSADDQPAAAPVQPAQPASDAAGVDMYSIIDKSFAGDSAENNTQDSDAEAPHVEKTPEPAVDNSNEPQEFDPFAFAKPAGAPQSDAQPAKSAEEQKKEFNSMAPNLPYEAGKHLGDDMTVKPAEPKFAPIKNPIEQSADDE